ncbi:MAG: hypothetical protein GKR95_18475 [Gammaproteobacteria bacterium]|nr:hypothetical protein [Gammaproteobacteria bacterium]
MTINCTYSLDGVDVDKKFTGAKYTFRSPAADGMEDYCVHEDTTMTKPMGYCSVYFVGKSVFDLPDGFESYLANYGQSQGGNNWDFVFLTGRYTGEMDNGLPQGQGTFIVTDTSGTLNLFNRTFGDGLFTDANSFLVDGNWDKGELVGEGRVQMGNGGVLTCEDFLFNVCQKGTVTRIPEHTFGLRYRWGPGFGNTGMTYTGPILGGRLHGQGRAIVKTTRDSMIYTLVETGEFFEDKLFNGTETYRNTFETIWRYTISEGQIIDD